jgi:hypothetical protein
MEVPRRRGSEEKRKRGSEDMEADSTQGVGGRGKLDM